MAEQVIEGAQIRCSFGTAPAELGELPEMRFQDEDGLAANIEDCVPFLNLPPFGECCSLANPTVASATAAAAGALTPQPCLPLIVEPWSPGEPRVDISGLPALTRTSVCGCAWLGQITIEVPGTTRTEVD